MEVLQHSFLSSTSSLPLQTERHASSRPQCTALFCNPFSSMSATLNQHGHALRSFYRGSNELALKASIAHGSTRKESLRTVIIMRANAAGGYASALAEIGRSYNVLEGINADMEKLGRFLEDKKLYDFLKNPTVSEDNKKAILKSLADDAGFVSYTLNLLNLIVDRKRTLLLKKVVKEFEELYNEITNTEVAIVTSAVKIDKNHLAQIATKVQSMSSAKNVRMKNVVDASLVAGFVVRYGKDGSLFIDMSVKGQLDRIAHQIDFAEKTGIVNI
eukprot:c16238_g1_i1 orf=92-910(+)